MSEIEHGITYQHPHGYSSLTEGLGLLCFTETLAARTVGYMKYAGVNPDGAGAWRHWECDRDWCIGLPEGARVVFGVMINLLKTDTKIPPAARENINYIARELRDGVSNAADMHPEAPALQELKSDMTLALQELDTTQ